MNPIEFLRQFHLGPYAIFDFSLAFLGIYLFAPLLSKIFLKLRLYIPTRNWLFFTLPISVLAHLLAAKMTPMTKAFLDINGHYILKIVILGSFVLGLIGIKIIKKNKLPTKADIKKLNGKHPKLKLFSAILFLIIVAGLFLFSLKPTHVSPPATILPYQNSALAIDTRVADLMSRMTSAEKIGQMVLVEKNSIHNIDDITQYNLGALLSGGGATPAKNTPLEWLQMVNRFQSAAKNTRLGIPLLYGIDAIHGHANVLGATIFPHFIGLGATRNPDLVKQVATATAEEMTATGIYWNFAPNLDVAKDIRWGKTYETFGSDTANVAQLGLAYLEGLQKSSNNYLEVLATPKHFLGGGSMEYGTARNKNFKVEEGNITLDEKSLRQIHLVPFQKAVTAGAQVIMVGTASWNGLQNSSNYHLLTEILKQELKFSGFIVSDWYGVYGIENSKYNSIVKAVNAGIDMAMTPFEYKDFISNMQTALANGDITIERLDDAVKRILTVKFKTGLFDRPAATQEGLSVIGSDQHRNLAREAVQKSLVLLKNNKTVPISKNTPLILVAGSAADNLGKQCGGWTVEWQGIDGNWIPGTTILKGIRDLASPTTKVEFDLHGKFPQQKGLAEIGIAVVGEKPYAEGWGDNANPSLSAEDLATISNLKKVSKKIIVIIISGRPLDIKAYAKDWDAIIAAWLPGSEGQGIADVLFGDYPFTGTLPVAWDL